jgi:hypothetical protein
MSAISRIAKYITDAGIIESGHAVISGKPVHKIEVSHKDKPSEKKHGLVINPAFYSSKHDINLSGNIIGDGIHKQDVKHAQIIPNTIYSEALHNDKTKHKHVLLGGGLLVNTDMINVHRHHK